MRMKVGTAASAAERSLPFSGRSSRTVKPLFGANRAENWTKDETLAASTGRMHIERPPSVGSEGRRLVNRLARSASGHNLTLASVGFPLGWLPMITYEDAIALVERELAKMSAFEDDELVVYEEQTIEQPFGWVLFWGSALYVKTGDV